MSVVIPAYYRPDTLRETVLSVLAQELAEASFEIIVVDSSADDVNQKMVEELAEKSLINLACLRKQPEGPGPSRFMGARHGRGEFVAFIDSDCVAAPDWLQAGLAAFRDDVGLVQGRVLPDPEAELGIFTRYVIVEEESPLYETANMFYRRHALLEVDESLPDLEPTALTPMGGEDTRMAWQVKRAGWRSCFAADALVYHEVVAMPVRDWLVIKRMYVFPRVVADVPELRDFFYARYFFDQTQAFLFLGLLGLIGAFVSLWCVVLCIPYVWLRGSEPSRSLRGPLKIVRVMVYLARDFISMMLLLASSFRHKRLVL